MPVEDPYAYLGPSACGKLYVCFRPKDAATKAALECECGCKLPPKHDSTNYCCQCYHHHTILRERG